MYGGYTITNRTSVRLQFKTTLREERFRDFTVRERDITYTIAKKLKPGNKKRKQRKAILFAQIIKFQSSPSP